VGLVLGDADQQQREPAEDDVGADAVFLAVADGAQVQRGLHVAPAALDLQQLLVAQRDILRAQGRVRGAQQELAVQVRLAVDGAAVDAQQPALGLAQEALEAAFGRKPRVQLRALAGR
jgi:hypothetical protein